MARTFSIYTDIDIDSDDLEGAGWHHEDDCPATDKRTGTAEFEDWQEAAEELHRQAHPDQPLSMDRCMSEPCRTLHDFEYVARRTGRAA